MAGLTRKLRAEPKAQTQADDGCIQFFKMVCDEATHTATHSAQVTPDEV